MVLVEKLGDDLSEGYVVINIGKNVKFIDRIKENIDKHSRTIIKAWGTAISLGTKLALQSVEEINGLTIGHVSIGTEPGVEIPVTPRKYRTIPREHAEQIMAGETTDRVIKAMSWIEIPLEKA
jgi:hypothetical protein